MIDVDPMRGTFGQGRVLQTLARYRREHSEVLFGRYLRLAPSEENTGLGAVSVSEGMPVRPVDE